MMQALLADFIKATVGMGRRKKAYSPPPRLHRPHCGYSAAAC